MPGVGPGELGLAALATVVVINAIKQGKPDIQTWLLFVLAAIVGALASVGAGYAEGATFDGPSVVMLLMQGLIAGLTAGGVDRQAVAAENKRLNSTLNTRAGTGERI